MSDAFNPGLPPQRPSRAIDPREEAWRALLREMTVLTAQVEYLRLLIKLGVRRP